MRRSRTKPVLAALLTLALLSLTPGPATAQESSASPGPTGDPVGWLGAARSAYLEPFDAAPAWLEVGAEELGETRVEDGTVFMSMKGDSVNYEDWYELDAPVAVLRAEVDVDIDQRSGTGAGVGCGSALGLPRWFVAGVNNADEWFLARVIDGRLQVVDRGSLGLDSQPSRGSVRVGVECAIAPEDGGDYVAVSVDGEPVSIATGLGRLDIPVGPYDKAALFVATDKGIGSAHYDDLGVWVGDAYALRPADRDTDRPSE